MFCVHWTVIGQMVVALGWRAPSCLTPPKEPFKRRLGPNKYPTWYKVYYRVDGIKGSPSQGWLHAIFPMKKGQGATPVAYHIPFLNSRAGVSSLFFRDIIDQNLGNKNQRPNPDLVPAQLWYSNDKQTTVQRTNKVQEGEFQQNKWRNAKMWTTQKKPKTMQGLTDWFAPRQWKKDWEIW